MRFAPLKDTPLPAELTAQHRFSSTFELEFSPADYDVRHNLKIYGLWTPRIFRGSRGWLEKIAGGWTITGIITAHTGFPFTPFYNVQVLGVPGGNTCSLVYVNSNFCTVRPAAFLGGAHSDFSNAGFEPGSQNFPNLSTSYFTPPDLTSAGVPPPPGSPATLSAGLATLPLTPLLAKPSDCRACAFWARTPKSIFARTSTTCLTS